MRDLLSKKLAQASSLLAKFFFRLRSSSLESLANKILQPCLGIQTGFSSKDQLGPRFQAASCLASWASIQKLQGQPRSSGQVLACVACTGRVLASRSDLGKLALDSREGYSSIQGSCFQGQGQLQTRLYTGSFWKQFWTGRSCLPRSCLPRNIC